MFIAFLELNPKSMHNPRRPSFRAEACDQYPIIYVGVGPALVQVVDARAADDSCKDQGRTRTAFITEAIFNRERHRPSSLILLGPRKSRV
jgi:hypothetical protein